MFEIYNSRSESVFNESIEGAFTFQVLVPVVAPIVKARVTGVEEEAVSTYTKINSFC